MSKKEKVNTIHHVWNSKENNTKNKSQVMKDAENKQMTFQTYVNFVYVDQKWN